LLLFSAIEALAGMGSFRHLRTLILVVATGLAMSAPAVEGLARSRRPPEADIPPPPPPVPAGPVGLPERMIQDAAAYDGYMRRAVAISPAFTDADAVSRALTQARAYGPTSLIRGAVAYGAIAALQNQPFIDALRQAGNTEEHRQQMVGYILANPAYLEAFTGSGVSAGLARDALGPTALRLYATGRAVRQASYDIQRQGWSKAQVNDLAGRLAAAEAAATTDMAPEPERLAEARQSIAGVAPLPITAAPLSPPYSVLVAHALQLAAIAALGEAREDTYDQLSPLTRDEAASACLSAAKRNFHQCLAVAKPNYEDIFCAGQHALLDTGVCMAKAASVDLPPEPVPPPTPPKTPAARKHRRHG
jgi:hypothetical protein